MKREEAYRIAKEYIEKHNPNMWDGNGEQDKEFSHEMEVYSIFKNVYMTIQFEIDADQKGVWAHEVKLYSKKDDSLVDGYFGYGIDSPQNMTDTILDICREYEA